MPTLDITQQLASYKGLLGWNAFTDARGNAIPPVEIELFIKEHQIPIRRPKTTEINLMAQVEPNSKKEMGGSMLFWGAPDILTITLSGWIISPWVGGAFAPRDKNGSLLNWGNISNAEIVGSYIAGRVNQTVGGAFVRQDPDYYISPYGMQYAKPIVSAYEAQFSTNPRKQPFTMTLYLEK